VTVANPRTAGGWTRLDGVDLLRGLAIFLVLMNHVNMRLASAKVPYTHGLPEQLVLSLFWSGQLGVQIFFAVSGFLIASTARRRWGHLSRVGVRDFYLLRVARIAPLLLVLLGVLSALHFAGLRDFVVKSKTGGLGAALLAALTFRVNVLEATRGYLPGSWDILWSLSVEETFYLAFPLLCRILGGGKWFIALLFAFVATGPFARTVLSYNGVWKEYSYLGGMDAIALGCLTSLLVGRVRFSTLGLKVLCGAGSAMVALSICFSLQAAKWGLARAGLEMTAIAAGACMIMVAAAQTQWRGPRVVAPLLSLGRSSYEVYLTHMFLVFAFFDFFVASGKPMGAVPALFVVTIAVAAVVGAAVARNYSEPMNRYLRARPWGRPKRREAELSAANLAS
jgi:peptidoglycan/LPS O-acetylase OafA/YrhL